MTIIDDDLPALPKPEPDTMATVFLSARHSHALDRILVARGESENEGSTGIR